MDETIAKKPAYIQIDTLQSHRIASELNNQLDRINKVFVFDSRISVPLCNMYGINNNNQY